MNHPLLTKGLLLALCCWASSFATAQSVDSLKVNGRFEQASLAQIFDALDQSLPISIFYPTSELPDDKITIAFEDALLKDVLQVLLKESLLDYLIYRDYAVVIAPQRILQQVYSVNYYEGLEKSLADSEVPTKIKALAVGSIEQLAPSGVATLKGTITDEDSREEIIGAAIQITNLEQGTATDALGNFELQVPVGEHEMVISYIGYEDKVQPIRVFSDGEIKIKIAKSTVQLDQVTVRARRQDANVGNAQIGVTTLDVQEIEKLPSFMGEADVVKSLLLQPGVSSIGEGAAGFNVRGGEVDQNLVLLDEGFLFNSSHALGFFSTFNTDLISSVDLYKGNIPAKYGGRLASVMDVRMKDGDFQKFKINGGIGPVTSRLSFEGPLVKDKISFIGGGRSSYTNWILSRINVPEVQRSSAFFYDANARLTFRLNDKNTIVLSGYASSDEFTYNEEFGFEYSTLMGQFAYRKIFSDNVLSNLSFVINDYNSAQFDLQGIDAARLENNVAYLKGKEQLTFTVNSQLQIDAGVSAILYQVEPGKRTPFGAQSVLTTKELEEEKGLETAAFANVEWEISPRLLVTGGLRFALYNFLGPKTTFNYSDEENPLIANTTGTTVFGDGDVIQTYNALEPRISARYRLNEDESIKAGYSRTTQFINQIFNSDSPTPTSQWQLSTQYIDPVRSHNLSAGYFRNFEGNDWETSIEAYTRFVNDLFDYKDFAVLTVNEQLETQLLQGIGRAYGVELSIKKNTGKVNGWISYALTRTERQVEGINNGAWYRSNFDKPNDLSLVLNWEPNQRNTITLNFIYGTGRPTTPPVGNFILSNDLVVPIYALRNQQRIPDYHRLDLAYTIGNSYKRDQKFKTSWTISIYNVYARRNAFSVFYSQDSFRRVNSNRLAILGTAFPAVTFNFELL